MDRILRLISHRPWLVLAALAVITLLALTGIVDPSSGELRLVIDPSTNRLFPKDDPDREFYEFVRKLFGSDETMLVALSGDDIFTTDQLNRVKRMTERIEALPEVHHVVSLTTALNLTGNDDEIEVRRFVTEIPDDPEALRRLREEALGNPIYAGNLVSLDGRTTALLIYFRNFSDADFIEGGIDERISAITAEEAGDATVWITGGPHIKVAQFHYQTRDILRSLPLILLCLAVVLGVAFRTAFGVFVSLVTVTVSLLWTLGIVGWTGRELNMVTQTIVPLFAILPVSYVVHVVSEYYACLAEEPDATSREASHRALSKVWLPVVLTGLTTGAGFLATVLSPIGVIREFGLFAVAGMAATVLASLTLPPALFGVLRRPRRVARVAEDGGGGAADLFTRFATHAANFSLTYRRSIFVAAGAIVVLSVLASTQLRVGAIGIHTFPTDSSVRTDFEAINENLQGANQFHVIVQSEADGVFKSPENLKAVDDLQSWLEAQPEVGGTTSLVDYVKLCNDAFFGKYAIPSTRRAATQILFFCASDELKGFVDARHRIANVIVRANVIDTELVSALTRRIERRIAELPEPLTARVTGNPILTNNLFDGIIRGQAYSVLGAFALIYGILFVMFLFDWRIAAKALIPNVIPVAFYFGALAVTGIPLGFATSLIAPMVLGIAIDDTIHYFSRFTVDAKRLADERQATIRALRTVGRPVTFTTIALCLAFSVLLGSDLLTLVQFGGLAAATLAFAWLVDFTLTPALCAGLRIVTLVDTLTLDLGENPQEAIPLFRGLSYAQCRIVAQMASMRDISAGEPLVRVGEPGDTMYAVIDGEVEVWLDGAGGRRTINSHKRGDVIGEVGFFLDGQRSANMDVVADARLLRLTTKNLERLARRRPRISSRLFENLNKIQAKRLADQT